MIENKLPMAEINCGKIEAQLISKNLT